MDNTQRRTCRVNTKLAEAWRKEAGFTIEQLACHRQMSLSKKTIQRLLHGEPAYLNTIRSYAEFLQ